MVESVVHEARCNPTDFAAILLWLVRWILYNLSSTRSQVHVVLWNHWRWGLASSTYWVVRQVLLWLPLSGLLINVALSCFRNLSKSLMISLKSPLIDLIHVHSATHAFQILTDIPEEFVLKALSGSYSLVWCIFEHFTHEIKGLIADITSQGWRKMWSQTTTCHLWDLYTFLLCQLNTFWPLCWRRCPKNRDYPSELVSFVDTWKDRPSKIELSHYCSKCKNINALVIIGCPQHQLWRSIPSCRYILGELARPIRAEVFRQTEISQLYLHLFWRESSCCCIAHQVIFWLDVSVHIAIFMHVLDRSYALVHNRFNLLFIPTLVFPCSILHFLKQVFITIFKNDIHFVFFLVMNHFTDFD